MQAFLKTVESVRRSSRSLIQVQPEHEPTGTDASGTGHASGRSSLNGSEAPAAPPAVQRSPELAMANAFSFMPKLWEHRRQSGRLSRDFAGSATSPPPIPTAAQQPAQQAPPLAGSLPGTVPRPLRQGAALRDDASLSAAANAAALTAGNEADTSA